MPSVNQAVDFRHPNQLISVIDKLSDANDVTLSNLVVGSQLMWNGTSWVGAGSNLAIVGPRPWIDVTATKYGAIPDAVHIVGGSITTGTANLTIAGGSLSQATDVGKPIIVYGAGANGKPLTTTILSVQSATTCTLAANASTTVNGAIGKFFRKVTDGSGDGAGTFTSATMTFQASDVGMTLWYNDGSLIGLVYTITAFTNSSTVTVTPVFPNVASKTVHLTRMLSDVSTVTTATGDTAKTITTTAGSGTVTASSGLWAAGDVNARISIPAAGPGGQDYQGTITAFGSTTSITVWPACTRSTAAANGVYFWKTTVTSTTAAFIAADAKTLSGNDNTAGRPILIYGCDLSGGWSQFEINAFVSSTQIVTYERADQDVSTAPVRYGTNNFAAFKSWMADVCSSNADGFIPAGGYFCTFDSGSNYGWQITADCRIFGAGKNVTNLYYGLEPPTLTGVGMFYTGGSGIVASSNITMDGFTLHGPIDTPLGGYQNASPGTTHSLQALYYGDTAQNALEKKINISNVDVTGRFYGAFYFNGGSSSGGGPYQVNITDCNITSWDQGIGVFSAGDHPTKRVIKVERTRIYNVGSTEGEAIVGVGAYIHPVVSMSWTNCRFGRNWCYSTSQYSVQHHGTGNWFGTAQYLNCLWEYGSNAVETCQSPAGRTEFTGCIFLGAAVEARSNVAMTGCHILAAYNLHGNGQLGVKATTSLASTHTIQISNTQIITSGAGVLCNFGATFKLTNVDFSGTASHAVEADSANSVQISLTDVRFNMDGDISRTGSANANRAVSCQQTGNRLSMIGCVIDGSYTTTLAAIVINTAPSSADIDVCRFLTAQKAVWIDSTATGLLRGGNNSYASGYPSSNSGAAGGAQTAYLQLRPGLGGAIASAATINPTYNADTYEITGTVQITRILLHNDAKAQVVCGGRIRLIFTNAAPGGVGTGGTTPGAIAKTTAAAQNQILDLQYYPELDLWYPVV